MFARLLLGAILVVAAAGARAQTCPGPGDTWNAEGLLGRTADWPRLAPAGIPPPPRELPAKAKSSGIAGHEAVRIEVRGVPPGASFLGAARTNPRDKKDRPREYEGLRAMVVAQTAEATTLRLEAPVNRSGWFDERWLFAIAICDAQQRLHGYSAVEIAVNPRLLSLELAFVIMLAIYALAVGAAWRCSAPKLQARWTTLAEAQGLDPTARYFPPRAADGTPPAVDVVTTQRSAWHRRIRWKLSKAADPVFVSQDAFGHGSLGRLQLLLFTLFVGFLTLNILLTTGEIAQLSKDVLWLLGISAASSVFSRVVPANSGLSTATRHWLAMRRVLRSTDLRLPAWRDVVAADGEIDVTRVQAMVFTVVTLLALLIGGVGDLSNFRVSEEVQYLLGLSQVAYLFGKAVPSESIKRLEAALEALRAAEDPRAVAAAEGDARFEQAKSAAGEVLAEVFGPRFDRAGFAAMRPREALAQEQARQD